MKWPHTALLLIGAATLVGCASKPTAQSMQEEQIKAESLRSTAESAKAEKRQSQNESFIDTIPTWALQPPKPDDGGIYAVGIAESQTWTVAQKKAMLDAEFGLAKQYRQELSGSERNYTKERNDQSQTTDYTQLIDKLVARVPVVGFEVVKQEVKSVQGTFHSWVLLRLPYAQFNKVLQEQRAESVEVSVQKAFDDLDRRLKERAAERLQEQKDQQAIRQSEVATQGAIASRLEDGRSRVAQPVEASALANVPVNRAAPVDVNNASEVPGK